jgi:hypothetical protein
MNYAYGKRIAISESMRNNIGMGYIRIPLVVLVLLAGIGCESNSKPTPDSIGISASITAEMALSAYKDCREAGYADTNRCAENTGVLLSDKTSKASALVANKMLANYQSECEKIHDKKFCFDLLQRALNVAKAKGNY